MTASSIIESVKYLLRKPYTRQVPRIDKPYRSPVTRGAHVLDMAKCTGCSMCQQVCPAASIDMVVVEGDYPQNPRKRFPRIDLNKCTYCGLCVEYCPFDALSMTSAAGFELFTPDKSRLLKQPQELKPIGSISVERKIFIDSYSRVYRSEKGGVVQHG
ncbi:MAG: NADH-quinone oxidoreductase subunit I [Desulfurococcus sp.]|nr:NADH-quinone oxidoreductase subunit I [Desulfurococcus sp.]